MNVDATWNVCQRNHIDVVGRVRRRRRNSWGLKETEESLSIAVDSWVIPVTNRDVRASVWVRFIDKLGDGLYAYDSQ